MVPEAFELRVTHSAEGATVEVVGELDVATAPQLRLCLDEVLRDMGERTRLVIDLGAVNFVDSTGLTIFIGAHKRSESQQVSLSLLRPQPNVRKVLAITGLDTVLDISV
jgi:anti-sigma B factor antagonist